MSHHLSRRALLSLAASLGLTTLARGARADAPPGAPGVATGAPAPRSASRITKVSSDERGVTLMMELEHAPFPAPGSWHRDASVLVFVPRHHRPVAGGAIQFVVHFHGHNSTVERATAAHQLREQLFDSKQNAILVVPELAVLAPDSSAGKLEAPGAFARLLGDVLATLEAREARAALGASAPGARSTPGRVCVSAHSGGYHAAACVVRAGGVKIHEVYLFDALYADTEVFRDWVIAGRGKPMSSRHKLVSYFTAGTTETNTRRLFEELEQAGVTVARERVEGTLSRGDLTHAEAVSIRTQLTHGTVTSELNSLRDCLYASALRRRLRTSWFDAKQGARPLERRR
ncbi:MAG: hypothetical protein KF764_30885 [Labilithrix sp.]|nr:hypothetical protein [Labilithrix sp.]